jgi:serine/threonine-protein kinase RIO1
MDQTHPEFIEFLMRDLANLRRFFEKHGLPDATQESDADDGLAGLLTNDEALAWVTASNASDAAQVVADYPRLRALLKSKE